MASKILFLFLCISNVCFGQSISNSTKIIVAKIAKLNEVHCSRVGGFASSPSNQYANFEKLKEIASDTELILLTNNKSEAVRCYAFESLCSKQSIDLLSIVSEHLTDSNTFIRSCGCITGSEIVGQYFLNTAKYNCPGWQEKNNQILDSLLIFRKGVNLYSKDKLLTEIQPNPHFYNRIKQMANEENNKFAVIALSKFKKTDDIGTILKFYSDKKSEYFAIYGTRELPDSSFYPLLINIFEREWNEKYYDYDKWRILFQALAKYPRQETLDLFNRTTEIKDEFRYRTLCKYLKIAITRFPNKLFDPLLDKINLPEFLNEEYSREYYREN